MDFYGIPSKLTTIIKEGTEEAGSKINAGKTKTMRMKENRGKPV